MTIAIVVVVITVQRAHVQEVRNYTHINSLQWVGKYTGYTSSHQRLSLRTRATSYFHSFPLQVATYRSKSRAESNSSLALVMPQEDAICNLFIMLMLIAAPPALLKLAQLIFSFYAPFK